MNVRWQNELARSCRLVGLVLGRMLVHTGQGAGATVGELLGTLLSGWKRVYIHAEKYSSLYYSACRPKRNRQENVMGRQ